MTTYRIVRMFERGGDRVVKKGLTLAEAQKHCKDPQSSSRTCTSAAGKALTRRAGPWFDGYSEESARKTRRRR